METLVATLVVALAASLLVGMVTASKNLIEKSEENFSSNIKEKNAVELGASATADSKPAEDSGTVTLTTGKLTGSDDFSYSINNFNMEHSATVLKYNGKALKYTY